MRGRKSEKTALMRALLEQGYKPKDIVTEVIKVFPELKPNVARVQISIIKKQNRNKLAKESLNIEPVWKGVDADGNSLKVEVIPPLPTE